MRQKTEYFQRLGAEEAYASKFNGRIVSGSEDFVFHFLKRYILSSDIQQYALEDIFVEKYPRDGQNILRRHKIFSLGFH